MSEDFTETIEEKQDETVTEESETVETEEKQDETGTDVVKEETVVTETIVDLPIDRIQLRQFHEVGIQYSSRNSFQLLQWIDEGWNTAGLSIELQKRCVSRIQDWKHFRIIPELFIRHFKQEQSNSKGFADNISCF